MSTGRSFQKMVVKKQYELEDIRMDELMYAGIFKQMYMQTSSPVGGLALLSELWADYGYFDD